MTKEERTKIKSELNKNPELVPLTIEQKTGFLALWKEYTSFSARQQVVSEIPDLYNNRLRYRELLTDPADQAMFDKIMCHDKTRF